MIKKLLFLLTLPLLIFTHPFSVYGMLEETKDEDKKIITSRAFKDDIQITSDLLKSFPRLQSLEIFNSGLYGKMDDEETLNAILAFMESNETLTYLSLWGTHPSKNTLSKMGVLLETNKTLTELRLELAGINDQGILSFADHLTRNTALKNIRFCLNNITIDAYKQVKEKLPHISFTF